MTETITLSANLIAPLLPTTMMSRGMAGLDANDLTQSGMYRLDRPDSEDRNLKKNYPTIQPRAIIAVFSVHTDFFFQLYCEQTAGEAYIRLKWSTGGWTPWKKIT